jgi:hypothetical protein
MKAGQKIKRQELLPFLLAFAEKNPHAALLH